VALAGFPRTAETPDGLSEAHGEIGDGLEPPHGRNGQIFPSGQQEFSIAQNARKGIIHLVAQNLGEVSGYVGKVQQR